MVKRIDQTIYLQLLAASTVIERDAYGEKVLARPDGLLVKLFRRKRRLSSALFFPYALRFARNARLLAERSIRTVEVLEVAYCATAERHLVTYRPLPGKTLRNALASAETDRSRLLAVFADFVAGLHQKGIYFRSLHFGNVIVPDTGQELGLIDIADMSLRRGSLPIRLRARNFKHMLRYREDVGFLEEFGIRRFLDRYLAAANLPAHEQKTFLAFLMEKQGVFSSSVTLPYNSI